MKKLLVVGIVIALCAVVYAKVLRSSPERRACKQLDSLCGGEVDVAECTSDFNDAAKIVGDKVIDKATECMSSASSCVEAAGCIVGAGTHSLDDFKRGFERGQK